MSMHGFTVDHFLTFTQRSKSIFEMKRNMLIAVGTMLVSGMMFCMVSCGSSGEEAQTEVAQPPADAKYVCPMECEAGKTYDKAGTCPVCDMDMEIKA